MGRRADQGGAAHPDRARPVARQPGQDLEHRRRRAVCDRRARRRWRRLRDAGCAELRRDSADDRGGRAGRHGVGGDPGVSQDALSRLGSALDPDAGLCGDAGPELSDRRTLEGPERPQLPADAAVHRGPDLAPRHPRNRRPARVRRRHCADARLLGADDALCLRLFGAHRRRRPERGALRRLRRRPHRLVDAHDLGRHGGPRRHSRGDEPARPDQPRLSLRLRLHRDHRLVPRAAASARRLPRRPHPRGHLCRRAGRPDRGARAGGDRRHLPGDDALLHPGERHLRALPRAPDPRCAARRGGGRESRSGAPA